MNISISQTWKDQLSKFVLDTNTYQDPLSLNNDTKTYKRLYYTDDQGTTSLYIYDSPYFDTKSGIYYEVFEAASTSKAIFYYHGL
jgi:hypothetical protein